jgi:hypothetical protein
MILFSAERLCHCFAPLRGHPETFPRLSSARSTTQCQTAGHQGVNDKVLKTFWPTTGQVMSEAEKRFGAFLILINLTSMEAFLPNRCEFLIRQCPIPLDPLWKKPAPHPKGAG